MGSAIPMHVAAERAPARWIKRAMLAAVALGLAAIVALLVIGPLLNVFNIAFHEETDLGISEIRSAAAMVDVYSTREYLQPLLDTLILALLVTAL